MATQRNHSADFAVSRQNRSFFLSARPPHFIVWGLSGLTLLLVGCQPAPEPLPAPAPPSPSASAPPSPEVNSPAASPSAVKQYENPQAGFRFSYPADFVIADPRGDSAGELQTIDLWQEEIHKAIVAGKYEGGTEYPANVQIRMGRNPERLFLKDWVERQSEQFSLPKDFEEYSIGGQNGLSFRSTGLYEQENVVVASPDMQTVMVISLGTIGVPEMDDPNRRAFTQILNSFQLDSANS
ncbi:hypothetical protein [Leptolyngbya ohadii]|uniref:hypothetical protein n=1 Tax=Leptolyngbya ohadii TaxID=1962290 RepID=UPI00117B3F07|nr:hypothetical protein [Leptolyngbya ohadii]